jgi:hypothetical protein
MIPKAIQDEVEVVNYNGEDDGWDEATFKLMSHDTKVLPIPKIGR